MDVVSTLCAGLRPRTLFAVLFKNFDTQRLANVPEINYGIVPVEFIESPATCGIDVLGIGGCKSVAVDSDFNYLNSVSVRRLWFEVDFEDSGFNVHI